MRDLFSSPLKHVTHCPFASSDSKCTLLSSRGWEELDFWEGRLLFPWAILEYKNVVLWAERISVLKFCGIYATVIWRSRKRSTNFQKGNCIVMQTLFLWVLSYQQEIISSLETDFPNRHTVVSNKKTLGNIRQNVYSMFFSKQWNHIFVF